MTLAYDTNVILDDHIHDIFNRLVMPAVNTGEYPSVKQWYVNWF